jgi:hypothetical protein
VKRQATKGEVQTNHPPQAKSGLRHAVVFLASAVRPRGINHIACIIHAPAMQRREYSNSKTLHIDQIVILCEHQSVAETFLRLSAFVLLREGLCSEWLS